jgi:hypothetical protein
MNIINATLIIQAGNFLIAYLLLRFFFFKPVVSIIRQEQAYVDGLVNQLNQKRRLIHSLELSRKDQWYAAQQEFRNRFPDVVCQDIQTFKESLHENPLKLADQNELEQLKDELAKKIVEKVRHAHT